MPTDSKKLARSFNFLAPFYNVLKLVFLANKPERVISKCVPSFVYSESIAVIGGGFDNSIIELLKNNKCEQLTHLDVSSVMSSKAQRRLRKVIRERANDVSFVVKPFLDFQIDNKFSSILFPFYLDLFTDDEVVENIKHARSLIKENGLVYVIDFSSNNSLQKWDRVRIAVLYKLFQPFTTVNRSSIPDYRKMFERNGFAQVEERYFYSGVYCLQVFKRLNP